MIRRTYCILFILLFSLPHFALAQIDNSSERRGRIADNLIHLFPQLQGHQVLVQELSEAAGGMQSGIFVIDGQQQQAFLTSGGRYTILPGRSWALLM